MKIYKREATYILYSITIYCYYLNSLNIIPLFLQTPIFFTELLLLSLLFILNLNSKLKKFELYSLGFLFLFIISASFSHIYNLGVTAGIKYSMSSIISYFIVFYIMLMLNKQINIKSLLKPYLIASIIIVSLSLLTLIGYKPKLYSNNSYITDLYTLKSQRNTIIPFTGIFLNQNALAVQLFIAILSIFLQIKIDTNSRYKLLFLHFFLFLSTVMLLMTLSRAAIAALLVFYFLYIFKSLKSKSFFYFNLTLLFLIPALYIYFYQFVQLIVLRFTNEGSSERTLIWADAFQTFKKHPLTGVSTYEYINTTGYAVGTHNVYIHFLVNIGIIGTFFWALWILYGSLYAVKAYIISKKFQSYQIIIASSVIAILIHQTVEATIYAPFSLLTVYFFMLVCYILNHYRNTIT